MTLLGLDPLALQVDLGNFVLNIAYNLIDLAVGLLDLEQTLIVERSFFHFLKKGFLCVELLDHLLLLI